MATVIPVDEFISDEWYPGFKPDYGHAPWYVDPVRTFRKEDEKAFWFLDFHWQRGLTPMGLIFSEDGYNWSTQLAAEHMPLPPGRGLTCPLGGTHTYGSAIPVDDPREISQRARRLEQTLPGFLRDFEPIWGRMREEIDQGWDYFCGLDLSAPSLAELRDNLIQARRYHKRAIEIHFQVMYPLLANYTGFYGLCTELGLDPGQIGRFLQGYDTKIMETDRELWRLTSAARAAGLGPVFAAHEAGGMRAALAGHGGSAGAWLTRLDDFLRVYGWRTEGPCDIALPSWIEDPTPVLGTIKTFLQKDTDHDFEAARAAAVEEREEAVDAVRSTLTLEEQRLFDGGLASCRAANFPWWQDDHNYYIDLRVMLPMRWACQAIADRVGADRQDDTLYLFWEEIMDVSSGRRSYSGLRGLVEERKQYFDYWLQRRPSLPKVVGTVPESVNDPILIEIFGLNSHFLRAVEAAGSDSMVKTLTGVPASNGVGRGIARVLHDPGGLHRLSPGEVLVCESTSPNWTPAFAKIAACVCDSGGTLSHAAIVGREYRVPTVTGVGLATLLIADGDEVEVNGTSGQVTVLRRASAQ
ncbi:MAG: PEP-utilizing enzyme [Streptosporangiaceae bacterium]